MLYVETVVMIFSARLNRAVTSQNAFVMLKSALDIEKFDHFKPGYRAYRRGAEDRQQFLDQIKTPPRIAPLLNCTSALMPGGPIEITARDPA